MVKSHIFQINHSSDSYISQQTNPVIAPSLSVLPLELPWDSSAHKPSEITKFTVFKEPALPLRGSRLQNHIISTHSSTDPWITSSQAMSVLPWFTAEQVPLSPTFRALLAHQHCFPTLAHCQGWLSTKVLSALSPRSQPDPSRCLDYSSEWVSNFNVNKEHLSSLEGRHIISDSTHRNLIQEFWSESKNLPLSQYSRCFCCE